MANGWSPEDFGPAKTGPQFQWLHERLIAHGFPLNKYMSTLKERVRSFQLSKGWHGENADGFVGPVTLRYLKSPPGGPQPIGISTKNWKETLPTGEKGHPDEVFPINGFSVDPWFVQKNGHLIFRANAGGVTTPNSVMPRSEVREMDGDAKAKWDTADGRTHRLDGRLAITALPPVVPVLVFAQCHDNKDDVMMLAAVGHKEDDERADIQIWRSLGKGQGNKKEIVLRDYHLGDFFDYSMVFNKIGFGLDINSKLIYEYRDAWKDCYWKAGCYLQTNPSKGEKPSAYGEVDYAGLLASHK